MAKKIGFGTSLSIASSTGGSTTIGQIRGISTPSASGTAVQTTALDSTDGNFHTFIGGLVDGGEMTLDLIYDPGLASHKVLGSLLSNRNVRACTIDYSSTFSTQVFDAFVNGLSGEVPLDDLITSSVTLKVTGDPSYATT